MQNKGLLFFLSPSSLRCLFGCVIFGLGGLIGDGAQAESSRPTQRKQPVARAPKTPSPALAQPIQPATTLPRSRPAPPLAPTKATSSSARSVSTASRTPRTYTFDPPTLRWERLFVQRSRDGLCGAKGRMLGLFKLSSPRCLVTFDYGVRTCRNAMRQLPHYRVSDATTADLWGKMWSICLGMTFNMRYVYQHNAVP